MILPDQVRIKGHDSEAQDTFCCQFIDTFATISIVAVTVLILSMLSCDATIDSCSQSHSAKIGVIVVIKKRPDTQLHLRVEIILKE